MAKTKEQLVLQNQKLAEEVEDYKWRMQRAVNQIHFLAWILYEKWVKIDERCWRLDIIVEENGERED